MVTTNPALLAKHPVPLGPHLMVSTPLLLPLEKPNKHTSDNPASYYICGNVIPVYLEEKDNKWADKDISNDMLNNFRKLYIFIILVWTD